MRIIILKYILINFLLTSSLLLNAQIMYPGDVTNNGEVNGVDVLFLGLAYGETGTPRDNADTDWTPQNITAPWANMFPNGLNHAYADCDGDGIVDDEDFDVVEDNFGETQPTVTPDVFTNGTPGTDATLTLTKDPGSVELEEEVEFTLSLGDGTTPVIDFYGLAFTINYDPTIFLDLDFEFSLDENSWITTSTGGSFDDLEIWEVEDVVPGEINIAITRIDQMPISGGGELGKFSIVVEDIIVGFVQDTTTLIQINKVKVLNSDMSEIPVVTDTFPLLIQDSIISLNQQSILDSKVKIFPNPVQNKLTIRHSDLNIINIHLVDFLGREVPITLERKSSNEMILLPSNQLPIGIYSLYIQTDMGRFNRKILKIE